jgi:hypothetical protein
LEAGAHDSAGIVGNLRTLSPVRPQPRGGIPEKAVNRDEGFSNIVHQVQVLQKQNPQREYGNFMEAIGTNNITRYFPVLQTFTDELNPNAAVLNRLQREAAGRIRLGLDLRGGTSFLMEMDTNQLGAGHRSQFRPVPGR